MKNLIRIALLGLVMTGCASTGPVAKKADTPVPTYTEKVGAVSLSDLRPSASCPGDGKWENSEWRKQVSYANACVKAKDFRKVELIGNHLAIHAHLTPWGPYFMSLVAQNRKDYPRAAWMLELALKKAPQEGIFHYQLGRLHWEMGDELAAIKELKLASDLNPALTDAHYIMGQMALNKDSVGEAEKLFRKALANDSRHWPSKMGMAAVQVKNKDWVNAADTLADAIRLNPRSTQARVALAQLQELQLKKLADALDTYKDLRSLNASKKLDESPALNLDDKIRTLEKSLTQVSSKTQLSVRKPTAEGQVKQ